MPEKLTAALLPCDIKHANAAGRLLAVLERAKTCSTVDGRLWMAAFNCNGDTSDVYARLALLKEQYTETLDFCETYKGKEHRWTKSLPKVLAAIQPNSLNDNVQSHLNGITDEVFLLLESIAEQMPQETPISKDDFAELNRMLDELWVLVRDGEDFKGQLRLWLLNLIRMMKDGLCRYDIKGARGLRADLFVMATELTFLFDSIEKDNQENQPKEAIGTFRKLSSGFLNRLKTVLDAAVKYAPVIRLGFEGLKAFSPDSIGISHHLPSSDKTEP